MVSSRTLPNIVARMQQHLSAFDFCLQQGDFASAKLKAMQMNMDLEPDKQVKIGHGIDALTIPKDAKTKEDLEQAKLLDPHCHLCKGSTEICHIHPPQELLDARSKNNRIAIEMEWLTRFILLVENQIREVGYTKGWWAE